MKRIYCMWLLTALAFAGQAWAGNVITVADVDLPQGGQATLEVGCEFDTEYTAFELELSLPDGLSLVVDDEDGKPVVAKGFAGDHALSGSLVSNGNYKFTCYSMTNSSLPTSGTLMRVTVVADGMVSIGDSFAGHIVNSEFTRTADSEGEPLADVDFTLHITELRTILNETATVMPEAATDVNVRLNRSIRAGEWSTLVLPFSATGEQLKSAFGDDVQLAEFTAWSSEEDDDGAIVGIVVTFKSLNVSDGLEANVPVLVKVSTDIATATFDGVTLEPEETPEVRVGKKAAERGYFYGTYVTRKVPEENLFLSGNKFWYSTGKTTTKGYRGYFEFRDVLDAYYDASEVKVQFFVDGAPTRIDGLTRECEDGAVYSLSGVRLTKAQRGVNIVNGKKIYVK